MDFDLNLFLKSLEAGIGLLPSAIMAGILLAGPTAIWLLYRFVVQPRTSRYRAGHAGTMWVCPECRSVNELRVAQCYRCDLVPEEADLYFIDPELGAPVPVGLPMTAATDRKPVGPGRPELKALPGMAGVRGVTASEARPAALSDRGVPVGPGRPRPARPRRAVVADRGRTGPGQRDDPPAA